MGSPAISTMKILLLLVAIVAAEARRFTPGAAIQWKPHIIGGSDASDGQFPHQLSLEYNSPLSGWYHTCGAVLIGSDKVLCAAHCVDGRQPPVSDFRVKYNTITLQDPNSAGDGSQGFPNDISVFRTTAPVSGANTSL